MKNANNKGLSEEEKETLHRVMNNISFLVENIIKRTTGFIDAAVTIGGAVETMVQLSANRTKGDGSEERKVFMEGFIMGSDLISNFKAEAERERSNPLNDKVDISGLEKDFNEYYNNKKKK